MSHARQKKRPAKPAQKPAAPVTPAPPPAETETATVKRIKTIEREVLAIRCELAAGHHELLGLLAAMEARLVARLDETTISDVLVERVLAMASRVRERTDVLEDAAKKTP